MVRLIIKYKIICIVVVFMICFALDFQHTYVNQGFIWFIQQYLASYVPRIPVIGTYIHPNNNYPVHSPQNFWGMICLLSIDTSCVWINLSPCWVTIPPDFWLLIGSRFVLPLSSLISWRAVRPSRDRWVITCQLSSLYGLSWPAVTKVPERELPIHKFRVRSHISITFWAFHPLNFLRYFVCFSLR